MTFDFLDFQDGGLVRLLTTGRPERLVLAGDIIGMPAGIRHTAETGAPRIVRVIGWAAAIAFEVSAIALMALAFRWAVGEWTSVWILLLPPIALLAPLIISPLVADAVSPRLEPRFPRELLPCGLRFRSFPHPDVVLAPGDVLEYEMYLGAGPRERELSHRQSPDA